jgi:hypothetical protein
MIDPMERQRQEATEEVISTENAEPGSSTDPPKAYIPACGTLCDAFWWARRSGDREKSSD